MGVSNSWAEFATLFLSTRSTFVEHEKATAELKELMPEDTKEAFGYDIRAKLQVRCGQLRHAKSSSVASSWTRRCRMSRGAPSGFDPKLRHAERPQQSERRRMRCRHSETEGNLGDRPGFTATQSIVRTASAAECGLCQRRRNPPAPARGPHLRTVLDHLVGGWEERFRHFDAEGPGRL
jgi:hypothetical protein